MEIARIKTIDIRLYFLNLNEKNSLKQFIKRKDEKNDIRLVSVYLAVSPHVIAMETRKDVDPRPV